MKSIFGINLFWYRTLETYTQKDNTYLYLTVLSMANVFEIIFILFGRRNISNKVSFDGMQCLTTAIMLALC